MQAIRANKLFQVFSQTDRARTILSMLLACMILPLFASCSTKFKGEGGSVLKIKKTVFTRDTERQMRSSMDRMISHEARYLTYGAITSAERVSRYGEYFDIKWKINDPKRPVTLKFEFKATQTGDQLHVKEFTIDRPKRRNKTGIYLIGDEFISLGNTTAWRFTIEQDAKIAAQTRSYLWRDLTPQTDVGGIVPMQKEVNGIQQL